MTSTVATRPTAEQLEVRHRAVVVQQPPVASPVCERGNEPYPDATCERQGAEAFDQVREAVVGRITERHQRPRHAQLVALALDPARGRDWIIGAGV